MEIKITVLKTFNKFMFLFLLINLILVGCGTTSDQIVQKEEIGEAFKQNAFETKIPFATPEILRVHESNLNKEYEIGPGDQIRIDFWGRDSLSGDHIVGPFGKVTLPMLGEFKMGGLTRVQAITQITRVYQGFYENPILTVKIVKYLNNKVYVLGRVTNPGVIHFEGNGSLLEALSLAGGLPTRDKTIFLSKCSIIRGNDQIIWVDLVQLLQKGNLKLNVKLRNNDIIHIPESTDAAVFVMGEVKNPGSYQIQTSGLSLLDAINLAGGATEDGNINEIRLVRNMKEGNVMIVDLTDFYEKGDYTKNALLRDDDIIFIPERGMAQFNYYLRQIDPLLRTFVSGALLKSSFFDTGN
jgi:polysaccharide export outer membrane protein